MKNLRMYLETVKRALLMLPFGIVSLALFIRSGVDYEQYLEVSVGTEAVERATNGNAEAWVQDAGLWAAARQNYWLDIVSVTTEPGNLLRIALLLLVISAVISALDMMQLTKRPVARLSTEGEHNG